MIPRREGSVTNKKKTGGLSHPPAQKGHSLNSVQQNGVAVTRPEVLEPVSKNEHNSLFSYRD